MASTANTASTKIPPALMPDTEERVEVFIQRAQTNEDPNYYVSVNGKTFLLPRGKKSRVPRYVAFEIDRAFAAQEALDAKMEKMLEASR